MLQEFIDQNKGKPVETEDPSNLDQCFDLAFAWTDTLGIPRAAIRHLYAYQIYTEPNDLTKQYFDLIPNTPTGVPQAGDLIIYGDSVGVAGHVCIFIAGNADSFTSFDQNWNYIQKALVVKKSNYNGVIGWLHPKGNAMPTIVNKDLRDKVLNLTLAKEDQPSDPNYGLGGNVEDLLSDIDRNPSKLQVRYPEWKEEWETVHATGMNAGELVTLAANRQKMIDELTAKLAESNNNIVVTPSAWSRLWEVLKNFFGGK